MAADTQHERDLITRVQKNNDNFAMKELLRLYRGPIVQAVRSANLTNTMSQEDAMAYAENLFRDAVKNHVNPNAKNKPSTFIIGYLKNKLMTVRYQNMNTSARLSNDLSMKSNYVYRATQLLNRRGVEDPTNKEIVSVIQKEFGRAQKLTAKEVERIRSLNRKELSGTRTLIEGTELSFGDAANASKVSAQDLLNNQFQREHIEQIIATPAYSRQERDFIRRMYGLGRYHTPAKNIHQAALNSGLPDSRARRVMSAVEVALKRGY